MFSHSQKHIFDTGLSISRPDIYGLLHVNGIDNLPDLKGKRVFLRVDLNVSPDDLEQFTGHPRVISSYHSIKALVDRGAKVVVCSHLSGSDKVAGSKESKTSAIFRAFLNTFPDLKDRIQYVGFSDKEVKEGMPNKYRYLTRVCKRNERGPEGSAIFTENPRLFDFENSAHQDQKIIAQLQRQFDYVVHDSFGAGHRKHFTTHHMFEHFPPEKKALGPSSAAEWENLFNFVSGSTPKSVAVVLGGDDGKFSTKLEALSEMLKASDKIGMIYLGGIFALAWLKHKGSTFGRTPIDKITGKQIEQLAKMLEAHSKDVKFRLPMTLKGIMPDEYGITEWAIKGKKLDKSVHLPANAIALDQRPIGFSTLFARSRITRVAVFGPLGAYFKLPFDKGTVGTVRGIQNWAREDSDRRILIGGGNTMEAVSKLSLQINMPDQTIVSTGGGAGMLAFAKVLQHKINGTISYPSINSLRIS